MPVTLVCEECGDEYESKPSKAENRKYCSRQCSAAARRNRVTLECDWCGEAFKRKPSVVDQNERTFCSTDCVGEWRSEAQSGEGNPMYEGKRVFVTCDYCAGRMEKWPSQLKESTYHFCSMGCRSDWYSENMNRENGSSWRAGFTGYYGENWNKKRQEALERDGHTCRDCGTSEDELDEALRVHHKDPIRNYAKPEEANTLENLVSLCRSCHQERESALV